MSGYHDSGRGGDRYAPPRGRESSGPSRPPPSGPSRQYGGPPPSSIGPPRHPSFSRPPYDSAPRGPRYQDAPSHPRSYEAPAPPRRPNLSLMSTQNPGGRDGYHHSGQPQNAARSYPPTTYRDHDRDGYDRDRDYRGGFRDTRYRDVPPSRDSYQPPSGPRDSYRDPPRHTSSSYHPTYSATPSPPTGPRHGYPSYQPNLNRQPPVPLESRSRERTPSGPAAWTGRSGASVDRRAGYFDARRGRDISPGSSSVPSRPRTPPYTTARREEPRRTSPSSSSYRRDSPDRRKSIDQKEEKTVRRLSSDETLATKQEDESRPQTADADRMGSIKQPKPPSPKQSVDTDEEALTQSDVDRRIQAIDEEMEATEKRIARIDAERVEHKRELEDLRKAMQTYPVSQVQMVEVKGENMEEAETEEEVETTTETPIEVDVEDDKPQSYAPPRKEMRVAVVRKRARPVSEILDEDGENIRVRIWKMLKTREIKEDASEENFLISEISNSEPLNVIQNVTDLPDFEETETLHQNSRHAMFRLLHRRRKRQQYREDKLRRRYHQRYTLWQIHMDKLDAQRQKHLERLGLAAKPEAPPTPAIEGPPMGTPSTEIAAPDGGTRGTRRAQQAAHARDYVQSEAEFLELMASLGTEEKDPTAQIPDMLPPDERDLIDFDESALIHDPVEFYTRALWSVEEGTKVDIDGWTEEENKVYLRRLSIAGKQFGRFRKALPLQNRSVQELVQHYYFLKGHGVGLDWRNVIAGKNRYGRGGGVGRGGAASVLIGSGAPGGKGRGPGRGRGRTRSGPTVALLQPKSRDEEEDDARSAMDDDGDDSGSITTDRVRAPRGKKGRVIESTAAKQRPKRTIGPSFIKEKVAPNMHEAYLQTSQQIAPSPAPSSLDDGQERNPPSSYGFPISNPEPATDRESSVPPGSDHKKRGSKQAPTSSYWRVNEMEMFPKHLQTHGTNWHKIAEEMGTKTAQQVKNYFAKNAAHLGFKKIAETAESGISRPSPTESYVKDTNPLHYEAHARNPGDPTISVTPAGGLPHLDQIAGLPARSPQISQPPPPAQSAQPLPAPPQQKLTLPTVASLLNSPPQEITRPMDQRRSFTEPLAPTPFVPALSNALPHPVPDIDADLRGIKSPGNISDISRSQSRGGEIYRTDLGRQSSYGSQPSIQTGPLRDDHSGYYREESRSESLPPHGRFPPPQQQNVLPPVRLPDQPLSQRSTYFPPNRYDSMAPPAGMSQDPNYARETYSRSPALSRSMQSPLPPPALPPHTVPSSDTGGSYFSPRESERRLTEPPRDPRDPRDPRFPSLREDPRYYERDNREYYRYEEDQGRYVRDRIFERERIDMHHIENERQRERDRLAARDMQQREREGWPRDRYAENYPPRQYGGLPPRPRSPVFLGRDYDREREEWERTERDRMAREREYERDRWSRR